MIGLFKQTKSRYNPASIWTRPKGECCDIGRIENDCCVETILHNNFPGNYAILGQGSTFGNTFVLAFPEQRTPAQVGAQANPR